ncbi:hypothetical protein FD754_012169 [Muntiacus muntjak]|uniref:Uncharacterized protein n=1 Tax=Muntiacus muntjak TaxID=9888 RepID=A0A5N3VDW0_MUNMU|nr:hypothetical protein FD754_012169 [Muntiacus muntjak]
MIFLRPLKYFYFKNSSHFLLIWESCVPAQVVAAVDVNTVANEVYKYNFPHTRLLAKTIEVTQYLLNAQFSSVTQSCPTLCDPVNRSTPGFPVHHLLPEFTQTHAH